MTTGNPMVGIGEDDALEIQAIIKGVIDGTMQRGLASRQLAGIVGGDVAGQLVDQAGAAAQKYGAGGASDSELLDDLRARFSRGEITREQLEQEAAIIFGTTDAGISFAASVVAESPLAKLGLGLEDVTPAGEWGSEAARREIIDERLRRNLPPESTPAGFGLGTEGVTPAGGLGTEQASEEELARRRAAAYAGVTSNLLPDAAAAAAAGDGLGGKPGQGRIISALDRMRTAEGQRADIFGKQPASQQFIRFLMDKFGGQAISPAVRASLERTGALLEELRPTLEGGDPDVPLADPRAPGAGFYEFLERRFARPGTQGALPTSAELTNILGNITGVLGTPEVQHEAFSPREKYLYDRFYAPAGEGGETAAERQKSFLRQAMLLQTAPELRGAAARSLDRSYDIQQATRPDVPFLSWFQQRNPRWFPTEATPTPSSSFSWAR